MNVEKINHELAFASRWQLVRDSIGDIVDDVEGLCFRADLQNDCVTRSKKIRRRFINGVTHE